VKFVQYISADLLHFEIINKQLALHVPRSFTLEGIRVAMFRSHRRWDSSSVQCTSTKYFPSLQHLSESSHPSVRWVSCLFCWRSSGSYITFYLEPKFKNIPPALPFLQTFS